VISGFRLGLAGAAGLYGLTPDLATFGKIIGGGMPVGAFGGRRDIMRRLAPLGDVYQAGTLSGNPVAMAAGAAALRLLADGEVYRRLESYGKALEAKVAPAAAATGAAFVRTGSIFWLAMQSPAPRRVEDVQRDDMRRYADLHGWLLEQGYYLAPSGWEVGFLNAAMAPEDISRLGDVLAEGLRRA